MITIATPTPNYTDDPAMEPARLTLALGVPIVIADLRRVGGPNDYQLDAAHNYITNQRLNESSLYATKNETAEAMRLLIEICAILAYCPGGVSVCGLHFESGPSKDARVQTSVPPIQVRQRRD